jgi:ElaB/YqjD/DUF883 family membrane-anchored ribosome-binding protein
MNHEHDRSADEIQNQIERTRSDLNETLSAIEHRLAPGKLVETGVDYLRHNGAGEYLMNLGTAAKQDPLPLALVGIGLGWLMLSSGRDTSRDTDAKWRSTSMNSASDATLAAGASLRDSGSSLHDTVSHVASSVRDSAARTSEKIAQTTRAAHDRARQAGAAARDTADSVRSGFDNFVKEQPLALGAIGLALGVVIAATAPRTRQEDHLMGEASDRLKEDAKEMGEQQLDRGTAALGKFRQDMEEDSSDGRPTSQTPNAATSVVQPGSG